MAQLQVPIQDELMAKLKAIALLKKTTLRELVVKALERVQK